MKFPQYRKFTHHRTFFKITSPTAFEELNIIGEKYSLTRFTATIFPDFTLINDLIENRDQRWEIISEAEYVQALNTCQKEKVLIR